MNKKIFRSILLVSTVILFSGILLVMSVLYDYFSNNTIEELQSEANYIGTAVELNGEGYLSSIKDKSRRITYVDADGKVLFDNFSDIAKMGNHADRDEIKEAFKSGSGTSDRMSDTLVEKTIYYALRLKNGNVIRVSTTENSILLMVVGLLQPAAVIVIIMLLLSAAISSALSKKIVKPINEIDIENPQNNEVYDEISPLLSKIAKQNYTIEKQIELEKRKQKEFEVITENMREGILVIDKMTMLLSSNSAAKKLIGATHEDENKSVLAINRSDSFREAVEASVEGKHAQRLMDTGDRVYQIVANPVFFNEKCVGAVLLILDVTEKNEQEKLRREFSANVSHELKTPLTSISGFAELMKNGGVSDDNVKDFSQSIFDETSRLISLVNDIIKISELDENIAPFDSQIIDIFDIAKDVVDRLKPYAVKQSVKMSLIGGSARIKGNSRIIDEMIFNLCDNAIKYNKKGGNVDIVVGANSDTAKISVRDNGIGIPKEYRSRVFERFFRVDKSHSKEIGGTGLGLSIVKHGAAYHDAVVSLESEPGVGTEITIAFNSCRND